MNNNLRLAIKRYLNANGIKQRFLAEKADIPEKRLSFILTGRIQMRVEDYVDICKALNVSLDYFKNRSELA
ncbi:MAG: helix-turn-helix domain-containing protein [Candidatus Absconditabacterales bacterium]|nr:helix-turn-helix domain-containing protein [Candidatus Absconditabacterales bacterium]